MKNIRYFVMSAVLFSCNFGYARHVSYKAFVVVPVADLVAEPLSSKHINVEEAYSTIPVSWGPLQLDKSICPRQHQLLFNEVVQVVKEEGKEVCVTISNIVNEHKHDISYWMLKKNICPLAALPQAVQHYIPEPIDYRNPDLSKVNSTVITLTWPLYDSATKKRYSAGTRFFRGETVDDAYISFVYDHTMHSMRKVTVPKRYAREEIFEEPATRIANFVALVRDWARSAGFIPLVWGGLSFAKRMNMEGFLLKYGKDNEGNNRAYWELNENDNAPHSGFDASGLMLRAAQICGIPYFFKNSTAVSLGMRSLKFYEKIEEGDLIWIPGGLMMVSDLQQHKAIGAFGYQHGFGKIVERQLSHIFDGITSYRDLVHAYKNQHPLCIKDASGKIYNTIHTYSLLKMSSLWES